MSSFDAWLSTPAGDRDSRRMIFSGLPVFLILCFSLFALNAASRQVRFITQQPLEQALAQEPEQEIYPYLMEQDYKPAPESEQVRALSDVTAQGKGALTLNPGFHTLTPFDRLDLGAQGNSGRQTAAGGDQKPGEGPQRTPGSQSTGNMSNDAAFRIPMNYRFQTDFALRYDGDSSLSIARQELAGFQYFKRMLRQIEETFAPPGRNFIYHDIAGTVVHESIRPGVVQVQFLLDREGNVRDVKKISSMGQTPVDEACMNALRGQNFGVPPPEIFAQGNIFGINFVFPSIR